MRKLRCCCVMVLRRKNLLLQYWWSQAKLGWSKAKAYCSPMQSEPARLCRTVSPGWSLRFAALLAHAIGAGSALPNGLPGLVFALRCTARPCNRNRLSFAERSPRTGRYASLQCSPMRSEPPRLCRTVSPGLCCDCKHSLPLL